MVDVAISVSINDSWKGEILGINTGFLSFSLNPTYENYGHRIRIFNYQTHVMLPIAYKGEHCFF